MLVEPDGAIAVASLGQRIIVAGLATTEAAARIDRLVDARGEAFNVTVEVLETAPRYVAILGEIDRPGRYPLIPDHQLTLQELLAHAGGFERSSARLGSVVLVRWCPQLDCEVAFTIDARPRQWTGMEPLLIQPHDVVLVPQTPVDQVNVWMYKHLVAVLPLPRLFLF